MISSRVSYFWSAALKLLSRIPLPAVFAVVVLAERRNYRNFVHQCRNRHRLGRILSVRAV